jgi:hypothetical protein
MVSRKVDGIVHRMQCRSCKSRYVSFVFSGETDIDTAGLGSAASCNREEVVIAAMLPEEWNRYDTYGRERFEARVAEETKRPDLRVAKLLRVEPRGPSAKGISFQEYAKVAKPPRLVYSCPCCGDGEATATEELEPDDFIARGGRIEFLGDLGF